LRSSGSASTRFPAWRWTRRPISSLRYAEVARHAELHIAFDEQLAYYAEWDFLVRAALVVGVEDTGHVTSIKLRWDDTDSTPGAVPPEAREARVRDYVRSP